MKALIALTTLLDRGVATGVVTQHRRDGGSETFPYTLASENAQQVACRRPVAFGQHFLE
jgi:hypothetical protein